MISRGFILHGWRLIVQEATQYFRAAWMAQFTQRLRFDLTDTFAGNVELFTHFFQRMVGVHIDTETHTQHFCFTGGQASQNVVCCSTQALGRRRVQRQLEGGILDEITQMRIFIITDWCFHGDWLFGDLQHFTDLVFRHQHALSQLFRRWLAAHLLQHLAGDTVELVDGLNHMHRNTDGARLIRDRAGDSLTDPPGSIGGELITTTVFKLINRFHQTDVAFLNQIQELQATVGVLLGDRDNQTQVRFNHLFLRTAGFRFTDGHTTVDVFNLLNGQAGLFFNLMQFLQAAEHVFFHVMQFFRPRLVHRDSRVEPGFAGFVAGEEGDEVLLRHFALLNAQFHDDAFLGTYAIHHHAHAVNQVVELFRHQTELFEDFRQFQDLFLCGCVAATFCFDGVTRDFVLGTQLGKLLARQFRVDAVVIIGGVVVGIFLIFVFVIIHLFLRQFRTHVSGGRCHIFFSVRVDKTGDQVRQARFFRFNTIVLLQQIGDRFRVFGNRALNLIDPVFDAFRDVNFAFAGQQFNGTHFAHVHADRVSGTPDFRFHAGQDLCSSFFRIFVSVVGGFSQQQIIGIRCFFHHLNTHVIDHLDDVFDLI
ncbi:hypothetical protein EcWSU1_03855 [Enterobacter ludwigii]|uniref:NAD-specific glutamate dehydrogenase n=1 Tax=Enterobacter ludwigii TaxID=299767 RepID=G8LEP1_9ENTR|nr:hypothetical protein EcWSU1_03855 [Enterobacter ludwigii]